MKKLLYLLSFLFLFSCSNNDPSCDGGTFEGLVFLGDQAAIDEFGENCYTTIDGNVTIGEIDFNSDIVDLTPLSSIREIRGRLYIRGINLEDLNGLQNLQKVGGLRFFYAGIKNLDALESLTQIGGLNELDPPDAQYFPLLESLTIEGAPFLESIEGLRNITSLRALHLSQLGSLPNLNGLENLTSVQDYIEIGASPFVGLPLSVNRITDVCALQNLLVNGTFDPDQVSIKNSFIDGALWTPPTLEEIQNGNCTYTDN
jgi:hypothetical protein